MSQNRANLHTVVSGVVQGVGFRFFAQAIAYRYNLVGYVRNLPDGRVEVEVEGEIGLLNDFLEDMKRGPISARVTAVGTKWGEYSGKYKNFEVRY